MFLQVSAIDLCADVAGWSDLGLLNIRRDFVSRSRKRATHAESDWVPDTAASYSYGLVEFKFKREALHELKQGDVFHGLEDAYDLFDRLEVLWAYAAGQVDGGPDELPDGWLRCVVPNDDSNRSRWPTHPNWVVIQRAFTEVCETPEQFGKIVRKRKEQRNIDKAVEAMFGYATSMSAWVGGDLAEPGVDISVFLHELASQCTKYMERTGKDFSEECSGPQKLESSHFNDRYGRLSDKRGFTWESTSTMTQN